MQNNSETISEVDGFLQLNENSESESEKLSSQNNLSLKNDLPAFDNDEHENDDVSDIPLPPPQLREKHSRVKLEDIEDRYLEEQATDEEIGYAKTKLEEKKIKNIFVNVNDYNKLIVTVKESMPNFKVFSEKFQSLDNINITQDAEELRIKKLLEIIQRKLIACDNRLFEKVEDE